MTRNSLPARDLTREQLTGCVLAGGAGRRMAGRDKGLVELNDRPLAAHVIARLEPQVGQIIVSANRNLDAYRQLADVVVEDDIDGFAGPLAGMAAALRHATTAYLVTVACDCPFFPSDLVARLGAAEGAPDSVRVAFAGGRPQPVFALIPKSLEESLMDSLAAGERKIWAWFSRHNPVTVEFDDADAFDNLNTTDDLDAATCRLAHDAATL